MQHNEMTILFLGANTAAVGKKSKLLYKCDIYRSIFYNEKRISYSLGALSEQPSVSYL